MICIIQSLKSFPYPYHFININIIFTKYYEKPKWLSV